MLYVKELGRADPPYLVWLRGRRHPNIWRFTSALRQPSMTWLSTPTARLPTDNPDNPARGEGFVETQRTALRGVTTIHILTERLRPCGASLFNSSSRRGDSHAHIAKCGAHYKGTKKMGADSVVPVRPDKITPDRTMERSVASPNIAS